MSDCPSAIYVGYVCRPRQNWQEGLILPEVPPSYRSSETKSSQWLDLQVEKAEQAAAFCKLTGAITSICAIDPAANDVFEDDSSDLSAKFVRWLLQRYHFGDNAMERGEKSACFYGFDVKQFLRIVGANAITQSGGELEVPVQLWYGNNSCLDPVDMLLEAEIRKMYGIEKLVRCSPIEIPGWSNGYEPHVSARKDAVLAAELCAAYQLVSRQERMQLAKPAPEFVTVGDGESEN